MHGDAVRAEPGDRAVEEGGAGVVALVGQHLGVGQAGVVIDGGVHVVVADAAGFDLLAAPVRAPPAAGWDAAEFLTST